MQRARTITLTFILFELFPLDSVTKSCPLYNLKPFKLSSQNFIKISISIRQCAGCKNHNSCIYTFRVIFLGLSQNCVRFLTENRSSYLHETSYKYQSTLDDVKSATIITLAFILFELFPLDKIMSAL